MRSATIGFLGLIALSGLPLGAAADFGARSAEDSRWLPWIGCWEGAVDSGPGEPDVFLVCFQYLQDGEGVEILTYAEGQLVASEEMRADGLPAPVAEGGCSGERSAIWSENRARVFLTSLMRCGEEVTRTTEGVLSMLPDGEGWVEIHAVWAGTSAPMVGIRTFFPASGATLSAYGIGDPTDGMAMAVTTARSQAGRPLTADDLVEAVAQVGAEVTNALLVERGDRFALDARTLRSLAARGVPGEVLDVMVAVSHPDRFEIAGDARDVQPERRTVAAQPYSARAAAPWPDRGRGYSPWGMGSYDPFWGDRYFYGYGAYGYGAYGPGGAYYGSSFYRPVGAPIITRPRVIVVQPPQVQGRGTVVDRDRGYVAPSAPSGGSAPAVRPTTPPPAPQPASSPAPQPTTRTPSTTSGSGGSSSGGNSDGGEVRRAVPRP